MNWLCDSGYKVWQEGMRDEEIKNDRLVFCGRIGIGIYFICVQSDFAVCAQYWGEPPAGRAVGAFRFAVFVCAFVFAAAFVFYPVSAHAGAAGGGKRGCL